MPKIIENVRERLVQETASQLRKNGYEAVTVRSVAGACDIGIGTVYNYFKDKDAMIAACMLADWDPSIRHIQGTAASAGSAEAVLRVLYTELTEFETSHAFLFRDPAALSGYAVFSRRYHGVLRKQLAEPLLTFCNEPFTAEFIAEAMITWSLSGKSFEEIFSLVRRLL